MSSVDYEDSPQVPSPFASSASLPTDADATGDPHLQVPGIDLTGATISQEWSAGGELNSCFENRGTTAHRSPFLSFYCSVWRPSPQGRPLDSSPPPV